MAGEKNMSEEFLSVFLANADAAMRTMPFDHFMKLALYDPAVGYYAADRTRVGRTAGTDFYTATTSGPIFGELIAAACVTLLGGQSPKDFTFVEIGAESAEGVMTGVTHPFGATRVIRIGEEITLSGQCVVFSNELFDAQPFRRFVFRGEAWRESGVCFNGEELCEVELTTCVPASLPAKAPDGYVIDAPIAAVALAREIAHQRWTGLFVACDYGKSRTELVESCPAGTARAYFRHQQSNNLLAQPGKQDLTCHVCWDWLADALRENGFSAPTVESQESFFVHHSGDFISEAIAKEAARFSPRKQSLLQLLHPVHLGQKFQVLHSLRR
jgi:SAM-dependent MidA family methyltransferase